jgi:hypothetical protein
VTPAARGAAQRQEEGHADLVGVPFFFVRAFVPSRGHQSFRDPDGAAVLHGTDALVSGGREAGDADLERVTGLHDYLPSEQDDGVIEGIAFDDSGLANGLRPGADGELKLGQWGPPWLASVVVE